MKKIITLIAIALISLGAKAQTEVFTMKFANTLTTQQRTVLVNKMINNFSPACRPQSITVGTALCSVKFGQHCMTEATIKTITEKTLNDNGCPNVVTEVTISSMVVLKNGNVRHRKFRHKCKQHCKH